MAKYFDEDNDIFVIKAKRKFVENLLRESELPSDKIAKMASVTIDFVINIQQKIAAEE
jgi:hypothetical protein